MKNSYAAIAAIVVIIVVIAVAVVVMRRGSGPATFGVSVSISPTSKSGDNGATLTYTVTVNNTGNVSDNYSLTVSDNASPSWGPSLSATALLNVSPGGNKTATLSVNVPSNAVGGAIDKMTITANGTGVSASKSCTASVPVPTQQENAVSIKDLSFQPSSITVSVGTTVTWTNNDSVTHNVTSTTGLFSSGNISPGGTFHFTFNTAGTYNYTCTIHGFAGTVIVQQSGGDGENVSGATSLQYKVDFTENGVASTYTYSAKNIGTSNMMMRVDGTVGDNNYIYILNGAQQTLWVYVGGQWVDLSTYYSQYWSTWDQAFTGYQNQLAGWTGGDWTYTEGGVTVRIYNIEVNSSLSDSLFQH